LYKEFEIQHENNIYYNTVFPLLSPNLKSHLRGEGGWAGGLLRRRAYIRAKRVLIVL